MGGGSLDFEPLQRGRSLHFELAKGRGSSYLWSGAIIGDGNRKRAPFLLLGLAPWYGTIFLFLEQIAPSPAAHARTWCKDFRGCRVGEMASEIPEIPEIVLCFSVLAHNSTSLWLLEFCLSIFVVSCSGLSEDSAEFRYVSLYIADHVVFRCLFYKNFTLLHSINFIYVKD